MYTQASIGFVEPATWAVGNAQTLGLKRHGFGIVALKVQGKLASRRPPALVNIISKCFYQGGRRSLPFAMEVLKISRYAEVVQGGSDWDDVSIREFLNGLARYDNVL